MFRGYPDRRNVIADLEEEWSAHKPSPDYLRLKLRNLPELGLIIYPIVVFPFAFFRQAAFAPVCLK